MNRLNELFEKVIDGYKINKEEAVFLHGCDTEELSVYANKIREKFCSNSFELCTIINAKSGRCGENCKFCAQSKYSECDVEEYEFMDVDKIADEAASNERRGAGRFSIVTSGRKLNGKNFEKEKEAYIAIRNKSDVGMCASNGLLNYEELLELRKLGVTRYHNNLETSEKFFKSICTTHTYEEKIKTIKAAKEAGMTVCSGGIIGLGENYEDRIDMAIKLRELEVDSVPINVLNPIKGTPFEGNKAISYEEIIKTVSIYRFILPDITIRLAGGRILMDDRGERTLSAGINGFITGDMLTTDGSGIEYDINMVEKLGFEVKNRD